MSEDVYWKKYAERFRTFPALIESPVKPGTRMIITIPVYSESDLNVTLSSLLQNAPSKDPIEVIILFNKNIYMKLEEVIQHDQVWHECLTWIKEYKNDWIVFHPVYIDDMPDKKGGVGWARKLAMDEAARRLMDDGIIVCLDGDCTVAPNYIQEIDDQFSQHPSFDAASIYYEHYYDPERIKDYEAIIQYELHLRYLVHAQRWCGHPFAFQTVGSAMAVRRNAYLLQGGMNTKRAGEDFYFLQKFIENGKLFEIRNTTVYPSSRVSNRVPFGTGRAMQQLSDSNIWLTRDFEIFKSIKPLFQSLEKLREIILAGECQGALIEIPDLRKELIDYLLQENFLAEATLIVEHTNSVESFKKRFFRYFNSFKMIRYMHYMRDLYFPDVPVDEAVDQLLQINGSQVDQHATSEKYLSILRRFDRSPYRW